VIEDGFIWGNGIHVEQFRRDTSTGASGLGLRLLLVSLTDGYGCGYERKDILRTHAIC